MDVYVILDAKGKFVSAWPKMGIAKIHCRTELKDSVTRATLDIEPVGAYHGKCKHKKAKLFIQNRPGGIALFECPACGCRKAEHGEIWFERPRTPKAKKAKVRRGK